MAEKTIEEIKKEINESVQVIVGKINNIDSRKEKADVTMDVLNSIIAGADLSKLEKAGTLAYLTKKRLG